MRRTRKFLVGLVLVSAAFGMALHLRSKRLSSKKTMEGLACARGITNATRSVVTPNPDVPLLLSAAAAHSNAPRGMALIPGGEFWMGSNEPC